MIDLAVEIAETTPLIVPPPAVPAGWRRVRFGEMAESITDRVDDPSTADVAYYVGLEHLDPESLKIRRWGTPDDVEATKLRFKPGDIIFGRRRAYQRKLAVAEFEGICSAHALVLRAREDVVLKDFLPFFMQSDLFFDRALQISVGSLSPTINWKALASQEFSVPPLNEQRRISEILWAVETEHRSLVRLLEAYGEAIGALTVAVIHNTSTKISKLRDLVLDGIMSFQTGPFGTVLKASSYTAVGTPLINPIHMVGGRLLTTDGPFLDDDECRRLSKYELHCGDIILGRKGDIGRAVYISEEYAGYILGSDCIRLRIHSESVSPSYFYHFLLSPSTQTWLARSASGTTMPGINEKTLGQLEIHIPPMDGVNPIHRTSVDSHTFERSCSNSAGGQ